MVINTKNILIDKRIPALDTLRVFAIAVLIVFHHAMIYVPDWGFHYKVKTDWMFLQNLLLLTSPWRMGLLWLISGIALSFMSSRASLLASLLKRTSQLLFPLLVGVLMVIPVQLYAEMSQASKMPLTYTEFLYALFFDKGEIFKGFGAGIWPSIDVNHLWFLRSLWQYSLLALICSPFLLSDRGIRLISRLSNYFWSFLLVIFVSVVLIQMFLTGDLAREVYGAVWFAFGFLLGRYVTFWQALHKFTFTLVLAALFSLVAVQIGFVIVWNVENPNAYAKLIAEAMYCVNRTVLPLALLALGYRYFNFENVRVSCLNRLVFPLYILHQSVSIGGAFLISYYFPVLNAIWHVTLSSAFLLVVCFVALGIITRSNVLRVAFGMPLMNASKQNRAYVTLFTAFCCIPIGVEILM